MVFADGPIAESQNVEQELADNQAAFIGRGRYVIGSSSR